MGHVAGGSRRPSRRQGRAGSRHETAGDGQGLSCVPQVGSDHHAFYPTAARRSGTFVQVGQRKSREQRRADARSAGSQPKLRTEESALGWAAASVPHPRDWSWPLGLDDDWSEGDIPDVDWGAQERERLARVEAQEASPHQTLFRLRVARTDRDLAQLEIDTLVPVALAKGASWSDLSDVLGVTRQALQKRYPQQGDRAN